MIAWPDELLVGILAHTTPQTALQLRWSCSTWLSVTTSDGYRALRNFLFLVDRRATTINRTLRLCELLLRLSRHRWRQSAVTGVFNASAGAVRVLFEKALEMQSLECVEAIAASHAFPVNNPLGFFACNVIMAGWDGKRRQTCFRFWEPPPAPKRTPLALAAHADNVPLASALWRSVNDQTLISCIAIAIHSNACGVLRLLLSDPRVNASDERALHIACVTAADGPADGQLVRMSLKRNGWSPADIHVEHPTVRCVLREMLYIVPTDSASS